MNARISLSAALGLALCGLSAGALAHGYLSQPESRVLLCKNGVNANCGPIQWEPQSAEGFSGFPSQGPADGRLASAGLAQFGALDEQTVNRWARRPMSAGTQTFTWTFTANHVTRNWRYYMTRADWKPNQVLSRASFDTVPFCVQDGGMKQPPKTFSHSCQVPVRKGYQVMLAVWEVGDTPMSFYNVVDLQFPDGSTPGPVTTWDVKGALQPSADLAVNDQVYTRVFDASGTERKEWSSRVRISQASEGEKSTWPFLLAQRINAEQSVLKAGVRGADGQIVPAAGRNELFARSDSGVQRVEVQIDKAQQPSGPDLQVQNLPASPVAKAGKLTLSFSVTVNSEQAVTATLFDHGGQTRGLVTAQLAAGTQVLTLQADKVVAGHHQLVVKGQAKATGAVVQKTYDLMVQADAVTPPAGAYSFVFPDGLKQYKAGTRVLQGKNGKVYECRPFPNSGFCVQWSPSTTQFEPGVGSHWREAWVEAPAGLRR